MMILALTLALSLQQGPSLVIQPENKLEADMRFQQKRIAQCVYRRKAKEVHALLSYSNFADIDYDALGANPADLFDDLAMLQCVTRVTRAEEFQVRDRTFPIGLRNLLAEEAYLNGGRVGSGEMVIARYAQDSLNEKAIAMTQLGDCLVGRDAAAAHSMLETRPGAAEETNAINALSPAIVDCNPVDGELVVAAHLLRSVVADALWARSVQEGAAQ